MKILVYTKYERIGASSRLRTYQYLDKISNSESNSTEMIIQNVDKFNELSLQDSFSLEEELLNELSNEE